MAITYPIDLLGDLPGWSTEFNLVWRQEQSRHASGRTRVKDFGTPIWQATYQTKNLSPNNLDYWRARLETLENGLKTFTGYPLSRCWPIKHPNGVAVSTTGWVLDTGFWSDGGVWMDGMPWDGNTLTAGRVNSINVDGKSLSLKEISYLDLSIGDFISINNNLYQVMEDVAAVGNTGTTDEFEVRPHLSVSTAIDNVVYINKPSCLMTIVPGSISTGSALNGRGSVSFRAIEARG